MSESSTLVVAAALSLFGVIGVGTITRLLGWLTEEADQSLLKLIIRVLMPCLILQSVVGNEALNQPDNVLLPPLVGYATMSLGVLVAMAVSRLGQPITGLADARQRRTFAFCVGVYNYGYLAIPLVGLLFDRRTLGVLFVHNVGAELAFWTVGVLSLRGALGRDWWKQLFNPPSVTIVFALVLNWLGPGRLLPAHFVPVVVAPVRWLGEASIPMTLVLIGAVIADELRTSGNGQRRRDIAKWVSWACVLRLAVVPALMLLGARSLPASIELRRVVAVQAAMPSAVFSIIMTRVYGGAPGIALRVALFTSLVSLVTIPLWIPLGLAWLHVVSGP